jgi:hypothetical protein
MLQAYVLSVQVIQMYIANVSSGCFKIDLGVTHVAMAIHVCFKRILQVFHLFQMDVANVSSRCLKCRSCVAHVTMAIQSCFKCFICFRRMLQVFHLDVSKVDLGEAHIVATSALL